LGNAQDGTAGPAKRSLRVIDHVANSGGGIKYVLHLLDDLAATWNVELHAQPMALARYRKAAGGRPLRLREAWPLNLQPVLSDQSPFFHKCAVQFWCGHRSWSFQVRPFAPDDGGVSFFPWLHRHDLRRFRGRGLGVFHDAIIFHIPESIGPRSLALETANLHTWFDKLDKIVVTSRHTKRRLLEVAGEKWASKVAVIPVADFDGPAGLPGLPGPPELGLAATRRFGRYLVMPANTSIHKNHRLLLAAMRRSVGQWNLVLTGDGTAGGSGSPIGRLVAEAGLEHRVFGLGYVSKELVARLIADAEALVMPTLGEGGGSFPVSEAIAAGTPVITSNLDVIMEQLERMGAQARVFDPRSVDELVDALDRLAAAPDDFRRAAREQVGRLHLRTWSDVARDFSLLLDELYPVVNC
jgi:glycosyltransferase involved in cell wall biosynthesis